MSSTLIPSRRCAALAALVLTALAGCDAERTSARDRFDDAERDLRDGRYSQALERYEWIVEQYPHAPIARTARLRVRSVRRELEAILDRPGAPRPLYRGGGRDATP